MQKDSYALFVDNSGSVGGSAKYWDAVAQIIIQYGKDITHYYLWNSICKEQSLKTLQQWIASKKGTGGTSPSHVATEIVTKRFRNIILVTDGQVDNGSVQSCDTTFETAAKNSFKIQKSVCYIIATGSNEVNMSVTCPFTRFCESKVFTKKGDQPLRAVVQYTAEDYKVLDTLEEITMENFESKYDLIEGLIIALNMGKESNIPLKNQLVVMKNRLVKELSKNMTKEVNYSADMRQFLEKGNFQGAIEVAQIMSRKYFTSEDATDLQKKISHLINLCGDLRGKYSIGQIKSNKMTTAVTAVEAKVDLSIETQDLSKNPIECPIILDEDVPQILVDECQPFLLNVEKHIVDDIAACPLRILNYPELRSKFKACLSTYTGVKYSDKLLKNPFTQNRLLGAIPLGTHKSHVQVGNYTIAKLISGGKILGNLNMYYAVIWYLINEGEIEYLKDIKLNATEHLIHRLKTSRTMAGLCGLAQFVTTQVSTDVAIWYCLNSGYLNMPTDRDTFRFHFYNIDPMIKMTEALGYPIHKGTIAHLNRTKCLISLLSSFKKMDTNKKKAFKLWFRGLYQNGIIIDTEDVGAKFKELEIITKYIPIDGEADEEQIIHIRKVLPAYCQLLSNEELYHISNLLDAQKSASDIFLDYNFKANPLPKPQISWCYGLNQIIDEVVIHPSTLRPTFTVNGQHWEIVAKRVFNVADVNILFKVWKYYQAYLLKYFSLPKYSELILFYYNRYVEGGKNTTLPFGISELTKQSINRFQKAAKDLQIDEIIKRINFSRKKETRMQIEKDSLTK